MEQLKRMAIFATVVERGSMVAAAEVLGMTASAVSQQIRKLEQSTQVSLLHRTTRKLTLTEAGAAFYQSSAQVMALAQEAEQRLAEMRDAAVGELRIAVPVGFSGRHLSDALAPLLQAHKGLSVQLFFQDERIDLVERRIDIAIRVGPQQDSSLVARHIGDAVFVLCAAPSYLLNRSRISSPQDLVGADWLLLSTTQMHEALNLQGPDSQIEKIRIDGRLGCNNLLAVRNFTLAGMGISLQPKHEIADELATGQLRVVLPGWQMPPVGIYIVTPRRDVQPAKVRYAVEALRRHLLAN
ncbi:LysR family transcriptional regulator [Pseudomonas sp. M30-35]|uniref:LysR family transcriptional regulator n=1 Tax=Pseudomonas sp. M30-35 TaxID=1981174 RepID=UPI000B3C8483|nr:LysR family transcriptional regulator [Pseudomonas sp. M30-35]ARU89871.1 LysR family transcriptional regulator [Pseudomonas sp. M30-35]